MKKVFAVIMVLTLSTGVLTGCGNTEEETVNAQTTVAAAESTTEAVETEAVKADMAETEAAEETETAGAEAETAAQTDLYEGLTLYNSETGISIYMAEGYVESSAEGIPCFFEGEMSNVSFTEETFADLQVVLEQNNFNSVLTSDDYGKLIYEVYQIEGSELLTNDYGNLYMTYEKDFQGMGVTYYVYFAEGDDSWWTINFMCPTEVKDELEADFHLWAESIDVP